MSGEDSATILNDFVSSLDNLPSELEHIMSEIKGKEQAIQDLRNKAEAREIAIAKFHKANGLLANNPKEAQSVQKTRADYLKIQQLSDDKVRLAERALSIVNRHCGRFEKEVAKLSGGIPSLAPVAPPPVPTPSMPSSPYTSMHSPAMQMAGPPSVPYAPTYATSSSDRSLKRKNAPTSISVPIPPALAPGPAPAPLISPLPIPTPGSLQANRPARPSRLSNSTSFINERPSPAGSDAESRQSEAPAKPVKRAKRNRPSQKRQATPDEDEDAEGEEDEGEDANFDQEANSSQQVGDDNAVYCYCQRVSYGEMVGCDNPDCRYEWFHFACVGIKHQPEGAWFCKDCKEAMSKDVPRAGRHRNK